ncbi:PhnA domain-containing protein [Marinobacter caseinilyticus]|uniref:PhnA domain-containing protein n=1 Tax=Marinobacter caseinilyticus TaxID=2692195 RepID=UPI00140733D3|nr:alkylphosphonate utilization protein [Marinobacter caseinilyticus]
MATEQALRERSRERCELCEGTSNLGVYDVAGPAPVADTELLLCRVCRDQLDQPATLDSAHWSGLSDRMWSPVAAVQVMSWRLLKRLSGESWAQDLLDMLYLEGEMQAWAEAGTLANASASIATLDANGAPLQAGDSVTLIKDLDVKGANFTAKRGTPVRNIALTENPEHIEGRVNGTRIVLLTQYVKKTG